MKRLRLTELSAKISEKNTYPVAIIGAGLGGLMAGACLAKNGFPVTIFEKHYKVGGYATTFERDEFIFDVSLHATVAKGLPVDYLFEASGVKDRINPVLLPELARIITPGYPVLSYPKQDIKNLLPNEDALKNYIKEIIKVFAEIFPQEAKGIRMFFEKMMQLLQTFLEEGSEGLYKDPLSKVSLSQFLDKCTSDPWLKIMLGGFISFFGKTAETLPAIYYLFSLGGMIACGSWYYKKRSQDLSNAFSDVIEENGGRIILNAQVTKILADGDILTGLEYEKNNELKTFKAKAVIANSNVPETMFDMLSEEKIPSDYLKKLDSYKPSMSMVNVWLGLNKDIRGKVDGYETFVYDSCDDKKNLEAINSCDPEHAPYGVTIYNNAYEGYTSNPNTSIVSIFCRCAYEPWREFETDYFKGNKKAYNEKKAYIANTLIKRAEKQVIPGLSDMIQVMEAATPLTNIRFTKNAQGAILGYAQLLDNSGENRIQNKPPVKGLYIAGAWGNPGGGYFGTLSGGCEAAQTLLKDLTDTA